MKRLWRSFSFVLLCFLGCVLEATSNYNYDIPDYVIANGHKWSCIDADSSSETVPTVCINGLEDDNPSGVLQIPGTVAGKSGTKYTVMSRFMVSAAGSSVRRTTG